MTCQSQKPDTLMPGELFDPAEILETIKRFRKLTAQEKSEELHLMADIVGYAERAAKTRALSSPPEQERDALNNRLKSYKPGEWFVIKSLDEMQAFFMSRLPAIREAARECGYAIGLHGSARRDFDLMAMPWCDDCSSKDDLASAVSKAACGFTRQNYEWEEKPQGRTAVSLPCCWVELYNTDMKSLGHIDLSVMATAPNPEPTKGTDTHPEHPQSGGNTLNREAVTERERAMSALNRIHAYVRGHGGSFLSKIDNPYHDIELIRAALSQPYTPQETANMWSVGRAVFIKYAGQFEAAKTHESASTIADIAPREIYKAIFEGAPYAELEGA